MVRRIQRSRERGSRQPVNTKYCGRPTEWGNPFPIGEEYTRTEALEAFRKAFWAHLVNDNYSGRFAPITLAARGLV